MADGAGSPESAAGGGVAPTFICEEEQAPPVEVSAEDAATGSITVEGGGRRRSCSRGADPRSASGGATLNALRGEVRQLEELRTALEKTTCRQRRPAASDAPRLCDGFAPLVAEDPLQIRTSPRAGDRPALREFSPYRGAAAAAASADSFGNLGRIVPLAVLPRVLPPGSEALVRASHSAHMTSALRSGSAGDDDRKKGAEGKGKAKSGWRAPLPPYPLGDSDPAAPPAGGDPSAAAAPSPGRAARRYDPNLMVGIGRGLEGQEVRGVYRSPHAARRESEDSGTSKPRPAAARPPPLERVEEADAAYDEEPVSKHLAYATEASLVHQMDDWRLSNFAPPGEATAPAAAPSSRQARRLAELDRLGDEYRAWEVRMTAEEAAAHEALRRMHARRAQLEEGYMRQAACLAAKAHAPLFHRKELRGMWQLERERVQLRESIEAQELWLHTHRAERTRGERAREGNLTALRRRIERRAQRKDTRRQPDPPPVADPATHKWTWRDPSPLPAPRPPPHVAAAVTPFGVALPPPPLPISPLASAGAACPAPVDAAAQTLPLDATLDAVKPAVYRPPVRAGTAWSSPPVLDLGEMPWQGEQAAEPVLDDTRSLAPLPTRDAEEGDPLTEHIKGPGDPRPRYDPQAELLFAVGVLPHGRGGADAAAAPVPSTAELLRTAAVTPPVTARARKQQRLDKRFDLALSPPHIRHSSTKQRKAPLLEFVVTRAAQALAARRQEPQRGWTNSYSGHPRPIDYMPPGRAARP